MARSVAFSVLLLLAVPAHAQPPPAGSPPAEVSLVATAMGADRPALTTRGRFAFRPKEEERVKSAPAIEIERRNAVKVNASRTRQKVLGFGGAFTESAGRQFAKLDADQKRQLLDLYFGDPLVDDGHAYAYGRVAIHACDFSRGNFTFDDVPGDVDIAHFDHTLAQDQEFVLPFIKAAKERLAQRGVELRLVASPWSPPAWMKLPNPQLQNARSMISSADPVGIDPAYVAAWAKYITTWIDAYKAQGVPVWAITVQNEPEFAAPWEACMMTPDFQARYVSEHLGPAMRAAHPDVKILAFDHNKDHMVTWADAMFNDTSVAKPFVDGIAVHWYTGDYFENVETSYQRYGAEKLLVASEACNCPGVSHGVESWYRAEDIAHDVIGDLVHGISAWLDWNLLLDPQGGPNHLDNMCDANVIVDPERTIPDEHTYVRRGPLVLQPSFFFFGHFSRFVAGKRSASLVMDVEVGERNREAFEVGNGEMLALFKADGGSRERWVYDEVKKQIGLMHTNMCMDVQDAIEDGRALQVWECSEGNTHQMFNIEPRVDHVQNATGLLPNEVRIRVAGSTKCLDVRDVTAHHGATIQVWECHDGKNQGFTVEGGAIMSAMSSKSTSWCITAGAKALFDAAAFVDDATGDVAVLTLNRGDETIVFDLVDETSGAVAMQLSALPHAIQTWQYARTPPPPPAFSPGGVLGPSPSASDGGGSIVGGVFVLVGGGMVSLLTCAYALRQRSSAPYANLPLD